MLRKPALALVEDQSFYPVESASEVARQSLEDLVTRVAHDLGDSLAVVLARTEAAHGNLESGRPVGEDLSGIELAARRSARLADQILASFAQPEMGGKILALNAAARDGVASVSWRGRGRRLPGASDSEAVHLETLPFDRHAFGDRFSAGAYLTQALKGFWMAYQPIVSIREQRVFGYEALFRCGESVFPDVGALLRAAQRVGRSREVGRAIRERVSREASRAPEGAKLFVNVHPLDLTDELLYEIRSALFEISDRTVLEITEQASIEGIENIASKVGRLRAMGFQIAMDDLGAGYAGLVNYSLLEPEIVKIDMSLVRNIDREPKKQSIVRSMMNLFSELGTTVVAEGIETPEERDTIVALGGDLLQGYLFAKPSRFFAVPA